VARLYAWQYCHELFILLLEHQDSTYVAPQYLVLYGYTGSIMSTTDIVGQTSKPQLAWIQ